MWRKALVCHTAVVFLILTFSSSFQTCLSFANPLSFSLASLLGHTYLDNANLSGTHIPVPC